MPDLRFIGDDKSFDNFINELSTAVDNFPKLEDFKFIFVPHMYSDLKIISRVIENCSDTLRTKLVFILVFGNDAALKAISLYQNASLVLGMLYSNVCPISLRVPNFGISTYLRLIIFMKRLD